MKYLPPSKKTVMLILTVAVITLLLSSAISIWLTKVTDLEIPSIGTIKTIGVEAYWDEDLKNKTEALNWDILYYASSKNVTVFLRSISNVKTILQLNTTNWNPINISKYFKLFWNYNGTPIYPGEVIRVTIKISPSQSSSFIEYIITNDVKEFSFDIVITSLE